MNIDGNAYESVVELQTFSGRYKVSWSFETNRFYFLVEVVDDIFINGYEFGNVTVIYNYDIARGFIDENASGVGYVFDERGVVAYGRGKNVENTFTYYIHALFPPGGVTGKEYIVTDLVGTNWNDVRLQHYTHRFLDFVLTRDGAVGRCKSSLVVCDSSFNSANTSTSVVVLTVCKVLGHSVAYCDNDSANGLRESKCGSDEEPRQGNLRWMNAGSFQKAKFIMR
ncbi:MAG: CBM9 family sugar-binding protein [Bacteroidetes bacterium]|nr:CBM9 family sugar-binding protein [Bacteroidota bacterium]